MPKHLLELLDSINKQKTLVKNLVNEGKLEEAGEAKKELINMQTRFDLLKDLEKSVPQNAATLNPVVTNDAGKNAVKEFADAARRHFQNIMSEGTPADGGYTVPEDIQTMIKHYKEANFSLRSLVRVEPVKTNKGRRTYQTKAQATGFQKVLENGKVQEVTGPKYTPVTYDIEDFAGYMPVTNDLLADSDANITAEITRWIGQNSLATDNANVLAILQGATEVDLENLAGIKKAVNVTLGQAYRAGVKIVTNDDGLNYLDTLEDANHRPLLNPNPTEPNKIQLRVGATVVEVAVIPNAVLATGGTAQAPKIPFIIGDLQEAVTIFDREQTTILSSNVASVTGYNAFEQRGTLFRAEIREDVVAVDADAWVNGYITPAGE